MGRTIRWSEEQYAGFMARDGRPMAGAAPARGVVQGGRTRRPGGSAANGDSAADLQIDAMVARAVAAAHGPSSDGAQDLALVAAAETIVARIEAEIAAGSLRQPTTEEEHQWLVFRFLDRLVAALPALAGDVEDIYGTASGGRRGRGAGGRLKATGVRRGIPDIEAWLPRLRPDGSVIHGLAIELKKPALPGKKAGTPSPEQRGRIARLAARGYTARIVYGWKPACELLVQHLSLAAPASVADLDHPEDC